MKLLGESAFRLALVLLLLTSLHAQTVVFLGDSITAGYGLDKDQAYPALIGKRLAAGWTVVNAGVSGDTSAGGLRRIDWALKAKPDLVVIVLGGNDGLRGLPVANLEANLRAIVGKVRAGGARAALIGMRMPANLGPEYRTAFDAVYPRLAKELTLPLLPFLLEGIALDPRYNQPDLVHPNAAGQEILAGRIATWLVPLLEKP